MVSAALKHLQFPINFMLPQELHSLRTWKLYVHAHPPLTSNLNHCLMLAVTIAAMHYVVGWLGHWECAPNTPIPTVVENHLPSRGSRYLQSLTPHKLTRCCAVSSMTLHLRRGELYEYTQGTERLAGLAGFQNAFGWTGDRTHRRTLVPSHPATLATVALK